MRQAIKNPSIMLLDVDGVILDYPTAFVEWCIKRRGMKINPQYFNKTYRMSAWFDPAPNDFSELIYDFNETVYAGDLNPYLNVAKTLSAINEKTGMRFVFATKFGTCSLLKRSRIENVTRYVDRRIIEDFLFVDVWESKKPILEPWRNSGATFIEDSIDNAIEARDMGLDVKIFHQEYNVNEAMQHGFPIIQNWSVDNVL